MIQAWPLTISQFPCTALMKGNCLLLGLSKGPAQCSWKMVEIPMGHCDRGIPQHLFRPAIHKRSNLRHVSPQWQSYSHHAGLCSNLAWAPRILLSKNNTHHLFLSGWHNTIPDSKAHGTNMGPIWGRQDPGGPHVGPMNFAIWDVLFCTVLHCLV